MNLWIALIAAVVLSTPGDGRVGDGPSASFPPAPTGAVMGRVVDARTGAGRLVELAPRATRVRIREGRTHVRDLRTVRDR